jgi:hypothetical protein
MECRDHPSLPVNAAGSSVKWISVFSICFWLVHTLWMKHGPLSGRPTCQAKTLDLVWFMFSI